MKTRRFYFVAAAAAVALLAARPAFAASCGGWSAEMEEDEGGSVLTARVCGPKGDAQLKLTCFDKPVLSYDLGDTGQQLEEGISGAFDFKANGKTVTKTLQLEAMYNYFVVDLARADPLLDLLRGKGDVSVSSAKYGQSSFPLKGSSAAIGKVLAQCGKAKPADGD